MRKIVMAVGMLALVGGSALAVTDSGPDYNTVRTHRLNRWGFDARGPTESDVAYRDCPSDRLVSVNTRRTAGDWTAAVLSLGWYTPAHTTVQCTLR